MPPIASAPMPRRVLAAGLAGLALLPAAARAACETHFDSDGVLLRFVEHGHGEPVVLVHGYASTAERQWMATGVFGALAPAYRVIALDARGHGQSGKPHELSRYGWEMGRDIVRLLDHLELRRAHLVGYGMGAHIVAQLLARQPERVLTATLAGGTGRRRWTEEDQHRAEQEAAEVEAGTLRSRILRFWPRGRPLPDEAQIRFESDWRLEGQDRIALATLRRADGGQLVSEAQLRAAPVPVLGLVGTEDPTLAEFEALRHAMPRLELVTIAGASHRTAPGSRQFRAALLDFLRRHPAPAEG